VLGDTEAPDATGTPRLSFGRVQAQAPGRYTTSWKSTLGGAYARSADFDGAAPFDLAPRLHKERARLPMNTALNFTSDVDIIGGNSGSPVLNTKGELVGLAFDGNLDSLPGRFHYDGRVNRMTSVTLEAIFLATEQLHPEAAHLAREMRGAK
jgi:Peptidase S46